MFGPWRQETWDVNDTVTLDPRLDDHVRGFFVDAETAPRACRRPDSRRGTPANRPGACRGSESAVARRGDACGRKARSGTDRRPRRDADGRARRHARPELPHGRAERARVQRHAGRLGAGRRVVSHADRSSTSKGNQRDDRRRRRSRRSMPLRLRRRRGTASTRRAWRRASAGCSATSPASRSTPGTAAGTASAPPTTACAGRRRRSCSEGAADEQLVGRIVYGEEPPKREGREPARQGRQGLRSGGRRDQRGVRLQGQPDAHEPPARPLVQARPCDWSADGAARGRRPTSARRATTRSTAESS